MSWDWDVEFVDLGTREERALVTMRKLAMDHGAPYEEVTLIMTRDELEEFREALVMPDRSHVRPPGPPSAMESAISAIWKPEIEEQLKKRYIWDENRWVKP